MPADVATALAARPFHLEVGWLLESLAHNFLDGLIDVCYILRSAFDAVPLVNVTAVDVAQPDFSLRVLPGDCFKREVYPSQRRFFNDEWTSCAPPENDQLVGTDSRSA